ncbi:MAG: hypothetical protein ABRQ35_06720 [Smithellaceae bacterium]|jgi:hypothetical protein
MKLAPFTKKQKYGVALAIIGIVFMLRLLTVNLWIKDFGSFIWPLWPYRFANIIYILMDLILFLILVIMFILILRKFNNLDRLDNLIRRYKETKSYEIYYKKHERILHQYGEEWTMKLLESEPFNIGSKVLQYNNLKHLEKEINDFAKEIGEKSPPLL